MFCTLAAGLIALGAVAPPVRAQATEGETAAQPGGSPLLRAGANASAEASEQARLLKQLKAQLNAPSPETDRSEVAERLADLARNAGELADASQPGPLQLSALNIRMQSLYALLVHWPDASEADQRLAKLRATARRTKAIGTRRADAIGDFWLLTANLFDINHSGLSRAQRSKQAVPLLKAYLDDHGGAAPAAAVRDTLKTMRRASGEPKPDPATGEQTSPPSSSGDEPSEPTGAANRPADLDDATGPPDGQDATAARVRIGGSESPLRPALELGEKTVTDDGVIRYPARSRYQPKQNVLRIVEPEQLPPEDGTRTILLLLPVESGEGEHFGDPIEAVRRTGLIDQHGLIVASPTLSQAPWYADHPSNGDIQQESYIIEGVVPALEKLYPAEQTRRLLVGFSKSGWGAVSLLARNPRMFEAAAAWDAPLMLQTPDRFGLRSIFGNRRHFAQYALPDQLRDAAGLLKERKRLVLGGYDLFRDHVRRAHELLQKLDVPHVYANDRQQPHRWDGGWLKDTLQALVQLPVSRTDSK